MIMPESSNFDALITYFNFAAWIFYGATFAALIWLRFKKPDMKRPYKVRMINFLQQLSQGHPINYISAKKFT